MSSPSSTTVTTDRNGVVEHCKGWLLKQADGIGFSHRRYFVAERGNALKIKVCYFTDETQTVKKGEFQLEKDPEVLVRTSASETRFKLVTPSRQYALRANSPKDVEQWIAFIERCKGVFEKKPPKLSLQKLSFFLSFCFSFLFPTISPFTHPHLPRPSRRPLLLLFLSFLITDHSPPPLATALPEAKVSTNCGVVDFDLLKTLLPKYLGLVPPGTATAAQHGEVSATAGEVSSSSSSSSSSSLSSSSPSSPSVLPIHKRGIAIDFLLDWLQRQIDESPDYTTRQLVHNVIRPETLAINDCYWSLLNGKDGVQGEPTVAISHAWDFKIKHLCDMIKSARVGHSPLSGHKYVWLDIFALTQHRDGTNKQKSEIMQLGDVFGKSIRFVLQILPDRDNIFKRWVGLRGKTHQGDLGCFDRSWCVFELANCIAHGARYDVACADSNVDFTTPVQFAGAWQPEYSDALHLSDKQTIDALVLKVFKNWNTLKAVIVMIMLKANNVGLITAWDPLRFEIVSPWKTAFPGDEEERHLKWNQFMNVYSKYYWDKL